MLGFSALSENPISSVNKVLELSASMTGLSVASSAAAGTLVGEATMSSLSIQTSAGVRNRPGIFFCADNNRCSYIGWHFNTKYKLYTDSYW